MREPDREPPQEAESPPRVAKELPKLVESDAGVLRQKAPPPDPTDALKAKAREGRVPKKPLSAADEAVLKEKLARPPAPPPSHVRRPARDSILRPLPSIGEDDVQRRRAPAPVGVEECEITWWRGYLSSQFAATAEGADGSRSVIAVSPFFRWRKSEPPPETPAAARALRALVERLEREGWAVCGRGDEWFGLLLRTQAADEPGRSDVNE